MAVESPPFHESLMRSLKLDDPWLPPHPWESIPSESGPSSSLSSNCQTSPSSLHSHYDLSSVSEGSLVRLVLNALEGLQSAVVSIEHLSALLCADPADRSGLRNHTLWNRSLSTNALGKMLKSIGFTGSLVILLRKFVDCFTCSSSEGNVEVRGHAEQDVAGAHFSEAVKAFPHSLVNQAFAVAIRTVLEGYLCALATLNTSAHLRRSFNKKNTMSKASQHGSLTSISHSEVTLLEIYSHTKELRTQIEGLGHLCHLRESALCFSVLPFDDLIAKAVTEIHGFYRGGNLLTYLYRQLQVIDSAHYALLKFLFLRSLEPYCRFISSWIFEAKISDPFEEFIVKYPAESPPHILGKGGSSDFQWATIREDDGVVPCFLRNVSVQLLRAGQQLQVVMRLLQLCNVNRAGEDSLDDILPSSSQFSGLKASGYPLSFNKRDIDAIILSRKEFYCKMHEKLDNFMSTADIKFRQLILHDTASWRDGNLEVQDSSNLNDTYVSLSPVDECNSNRITQSMDSDASSMDEEFSFNIDAVESSEYSSTDGSDGQADTGVSLEDFDSLAPPEKYYLSALDFSTLSSEPAKGKQISSMQNHIIDFPKETAPVITDASCEESVEVSGSWLSSIQYAGALPHLGWPVGSLQQNPLGIKQSCGDNKNLVSSQCIRTPCGQVNEEQLPCSSNQSTPDSLWTDEVSKGSNSFLVQSWNAKVPSNVLCMNPVLAKRAFFQDLEEQSGNTSKISRSFPFIQFSFASNPLEVYGKRYAREERHFDATNVFSFAEYGTSEFGKVDICRVTENATDNIQLKRYQLEDPGASLNSENDGNGNLENLCGGSSWQSLLGACTSDGATTREFEHGTKVQFDMPLGYIIDKCLLQEILIQYNYVSRFSIKLLEEGFDLQEHFCALRRYHFMEIADWADLFITSLWHHKWYSTEADQNIPAIQGLLASSIQWSSCEKDLNKDRLYAYVKEQYNTPSVTAAVGLHSFDFIGLGYKVDWPVNMVLTPSALSIYAEIFTFLIQLKLAVLSLSDVWFSLKGFKYITGHSSELHQMARTNFNSLVKLRHQVNHFVSTLQQYVLSQLSGVSWCRFCDSLKSEVKDMMNIESLHMAYLMDSLRICFLSDEMRPISYNMKSILQCALDFRSCLVKGGNFAGPANHVSVEHMSEIKSSQVSAIKENFDKNIKELHLAYLKSPKHGEFGLPRFWSCLNYNEYYAGLISY